MHACIHRNLLQASRVSSVKGPVHVSSSHPSTQARAWKVASVQRAPQPKAAAAEYDEDDPDGEYKPQDFQRSFFQDVTFDIPISPDNDNQNAGGQGKKKGKKGRKKQLLFSTDSRRK
eukprot:TRINITY_DN10889_c0_g1_i1.p3 TRINITY_DN10889_c0_g1~~TRINITY_DN10889_c0_g1_i1.p3  ORF type:complete len:117 (+),score=38.26 TRINITY_DN10889_c0_g1_i1:1822-2172(+)